MEYIKNYKIFEDNEKDETLLILRDLSLPISDLGYKSYVTSHDNSSPKALPDSIVYKVYFSKEIDIFVVYDINKKNLSELSKINSGKENELKEECLEFIERSIQADNSLHLCFFDIEISLLDLDGKQYIEANLKFIKKQDGTEITDYKYK